jgi:vancomycin permeability regulator SanA
MDELEKLKAVIKTPALIDALTQLFFYEEKPRHAHFSIVLGMSLWHRPIAVAVKLYQQGLTDKLILCGGYNHKIDRKEALEMYQYAIESGIPQQDILIDAQSRNTFENISNALDLIEKNSFDICSIKLNIVSIHFHAKRAILTAQQLLPHAKQMTTVTYPSIHYDASNWFKSDIGVRNVFSELDKLSKYFPHQIPPALINII